MRELEITLGGQQHTLAANFKASYEIAEKVGDPMTIVREAALEAMFMTRGMPYEPKWRFTITNIPQILHIGLKAAGAKLRLEEVQELVFETGLMQSKELAGDYLALIVGPQPTEIPDEPEADSGN